MTVTGATIASTAPPEAEPSPPAGGASRSARKKRMLIIVNPYATTVSDRLKNLVVYALQGRYQVEAVSTQAQNHATQICREAREEGYDVVVAFGGDGTLNEVANGLAGTDVPVSILPGGSTNVVARTLGIPNDVVDATEHLLGLADTFEPRSIDLGTVNQRRFVFACGAGLDATAARRVDANPRLKARAGRWFYTWAAVSGFYAQYLRNPVVMRVAVGGEEPTEGVTTIAQNSDPFTYFGTQPVRVSETAAIDNETLSISVLRRATQRDVPTIAARALATSLRVPDHRHIDHFDHAVTARIESVSTDAEGKIRPIPVQVDGDYIGDHGELDLGIEPGALQVIA
jgi:diacylglycerol kinase family enzyme